LVRNYADFKIDLIDRLGGLTMEKPAPLTGTWRKFIDEESRDGIVMFSLGSVAKTEFMPMIKKVAKYNIFDCRLDITDR
jgi:hypothetical protein